MHSQIETSFSNLQKQVPFRTYFKVEEIAKYHRVITMEDFMDKLAPAIWPAGKRTGEYLKSRVYNLYYSDLNSVKYPQLILNQCENYTAVW